MTFDRFTIKAQEAVQAAAGRAQSAGQQAIEPVHLLYGIMQKGKDVTDYLFGKLGVNTCRACRVANLISRTLRARCFNALWTSHRRWATSL